jgi:hypothetical protein
MNARLITMALAAAAIFGTTQIVHASGSEKPRCEDGLLEISGSNGSYTFRGYCEKVSIAGEYNRVVLGEVGTLEIAGGSHDVTAGNVETLELAGSDNVVRLGDMRSAEIAGSDHDVWAVAVGSMEVAGGNNSVKSDRLGSATVAGNDNLIEYRQLNPSARNPKKYVHPARSVTGSSNLVRWNKSAAQ